MRLVWVPILTLAVGCANPWSVTRGIEEPERMVEVILRHAPVGTPIDDAQQFMEQEGFRCSRSTNQPFGDRENLNYIYCDRSEGFLVLRRWQVAIVHHDDRVVEVLAGTGLIGL